jgi:predicted Rossmann-fold nucleotide-binding protein
MSKVCLGHLAAPCIVYNLNGYYDSLKALLAHMASMGLASEDRLALIRFPENLEEIKSIIEG